mmetsp:Transcript_20735/g.57303  ORF Transcript_20735/g.57303 Transcript_20735/m.57303 type:complete len:547 (+) Transcript_20735:337-1977(+)
MGFTLMFGRTQSDPFAPPTRARVILPKQRMNLPPDTYSNKLQSIATSDFLLRRLYQACREMGADNSLRGGGGWKSPKGGDIQILQPTQHVLEQSAVQIAKGQGDVIVQLTINLPARGRTVLGAEAYEIFDNVLSQLIQEALFNISVPHLQDHVKIVEDQMWLQSQLDDVGLIAFIRNGAILPRISGVDDGPMPMQEQPTPFQSPATLEKSFVLPRTGENVTGMGVPKGITLICGGGFHGKSTLLQAIQWGVYGAKVPGDGREFCVTNPTAMKVRAEDGRSVQAVDISSFINNLPFDKDTTCFSTSDASGSTSQASNIVEAIELGTKSLLLDEDTCAGNCIFRDEKMKLLIANDKEPISPFINYVGSLKRDLSISTVMVVGAIGELFSVADLVLVMDSYRCEDATLRAKDIVRGSTSQPIPSQSFGNIKNRIVVRDKFDPNGKVKTPRRGLIVYGDTEIDLSSVEQVVSFCQTTAISAYLQKLAAGAGANSKQPLLDVLDALDGLVDSQGLDALAVSQFHGGFTRPRKMEVGAAFNRIRRKGAVHQK